MISQTKNNTAALHPNRFSQSRAHPVLVASECQTSFFPTFNTRIQNSLRPTINPERLETSLKAIQPMAWLKCPVKIHDSNAIQQENIIFMASSYSSSDDGSGFLSDLLSNRSSHKSNKQSKRRYSFCSSDIGKMECLSSLSEQKEADSKSEAKREEEKQSEAGENDSSTSQMSLSAYMPQVKWLLMSELNDDRISNSGVSLTSTLPASNPNPKTRTRLLAKRQAQASIPESLFKSH